MNYSWELRSVDVETQTRVGCCVFRVADDNQPVMIGYTMRGAPGDRGEPLGLGEAGRMFLGHQLPVFTLENAAPSPPSPTFSFCLRFPVFARCARRLSSCHGCTVSNYLIALEGGGGY